MVDTSWMNTISPRSMTDPMSDRRVVDHGWGEPRFPSDDPGVARNPPMPIDRALREYCHINAKAFVVAAVLEGGTVEYFSGPGRLDDKDIVKIMDADKALDYQSRRGAAGLVADQAFSLSHLGRALPYVGSRRGNSGESVGRDGSLSLDSCRRRRTGSGRKKEPEEASPPRVTKIAMKIGNEREVSKFYAQRFKDIQQTACKLVAKAWIKAVAPRKQSTYPYTGENIPDWWPKPWGETPYEEVRHKEPDHLKKYERIPLLVHLLRLIVEPNTCQHPDIRELNLTVSRLEIVTRDALSLFFAESRKNEDKRAFLKEVFKVAKIEEQYKRGERSANTDVYVTPADQRMDEDDDEDENEDEGAFSPAKPVHPESSLSITLHQTTSSSIPGSTSMMTPPAPHPHYSSAAMTTAMGTNHSPYMDQSTPMQIDDDMQGHQGPGRRTSMYTSSPSEYASSCGPQVPLYPTATSTAGSPWQQTTSAPPGGPLYAFNHNQPPLPLPQPQAHSQGHSPGGYAQPHHMDVQLGQHSYISPSYDGLPLPNSVFRNISGNGSPGHGQGHGTAPYGQRN